VRFQWSLKWVGGLLWEIVYEKFQPVTKGCKKTHHQRMQKNTFAKKAGAAWQLGMTTRTAFVCAACVSVTTLVQTWRLWRNGSSGWDADRRVSQSICVARWRRYVVIDLVTYTNTTHCYSYHHPQIIIIYFIIIIIIIDADKHINHGKNLTPKTNKLLR